MATGYLEHTLSAADTNGNKKATFSAWMKRAKNGVEHVFYTVRQNSTNFFRFRFDSDKINVTSQVSGTNYYATTDAVFRDNSAFYHVVVTYDTTQATASNRIKIYVNGTEQTLSASNYPSQDATLFMIASGQPQRVGQESGSGYFDGVMAHVHYTEGYAYAATDFGETDSTSGIWKPKTSPSVSYGTNGFFLKFENSGAMGTDSSGNSNTFTVNNSITQNVDTPSNNFATMNPLDNIYFGGTYSNGNLTIQSESSSYTFCTSTLGVSAGKWYVEAKLSAADSGGTRIGGTGRTSTGSNNNLGDRASEFMYQTNGDLKISNTTTSSWGSTWTTNDIIGIALDLDNNKVYFSKNGTFQASGNPSTGSNGQTITAASSTSDGFYRFGFSDNDSGGTATFHYNFGSGFFGTTAVASANADGNGIGAFEYTVPTGYYALCTKNIKEFG